MDPVAIITGASQGIGAGLVEAYLAKGYHVIANSRTIAPSDNNSLISVAGDIGDRSTAEALVRTALDRFGKIDSLVNNAGIFIGKPFVDYAGDDFERVMKTNVSGFFHVTQLSAQAMLERGRGHILTITTSLADQPMKAAPAGMAALSKGGLNAITGSLAIEYADRGIRVNAISPGIIDTPMHDPAAHGFLATLHPMKRLGLVEEVVGAALYLEDATFVTGEILHVDGGVHAGQW